MDFDVSVIMPTRNEENTIGICIRKIQKVFKDNNIKGEIIISDSSNDRTAQIASDLGTKIIHPKGLGYGYAYREAFQHVRGRYIVMGDADNTYDFLEMPLLIALLDEGYDFVMGSRFKGTIRKGAMPPLHRYIGNPLLSWILNIVFHTHISDVHCGFRAIRTDVLKKLKFKTSGMEFASEMIIEAARCGLAIGEVPITYYPRQSPSKLISFLDGWRHLRFIMLYRPILFLIFPGLIFGVFGLALLAGSFLQGNVEEAHMHTFLLGAIALIGGFQAILLGINIQIYSIVHGFTERSGRIAKLMDYMSFERELIAGGILMLMGGLIGLWILIKWIQIGFGSLFEIVNAVLSLVFLLCGMQLIFSTIFASMMILHEE